MEEGRPAYHPALLLKVWLYAYALGVTSARRPAARRKNALFAADEFFAARISNPHTRRAYARPWAASRSRSALRSAVGPLRSVPVCSFRLT